MKVLCMMALATCGQLRFIVDVKLEGKIKNSNSKYYLVDFSKSAKGKEYCSDLSEPVFVEKEKCMKVED